MIDFAESDPRRLKNFFSRLKYIRSEETSVQKRIEAIESYLESAKKSKKYDSLTLRSIERRLEKLKEKIKDL